MISGRLLIIGGDGIVGRRMVKDLNASNIEFLWTSRRLVMSDSNARRVHFALGKSSVKPLLDWKPTHAILLAGATSISTCEANPVATRSVNVEASAALIDDLADAGIRTTAVSTSQVFGRDQFAPGVNDERYPTCEYGRQKADLEDHALSRGGQVARCTKILAPGQGVVANWISDLRRAKRVKAFQNVAIAPIPVQWAGAALLEICLQGHSEGIFHLTSGDECSYFHVATMVANHLGVSLEMVTPTTVKHDPAAGVLVGAHAALGSAYSSPRLEVPFTEQTISKYVLDEESHAG